MIAQVIAVIAKRLLLKKSPQNTLFFAYALLSLAKQAVVSRKSANQLQCSCNPLAVVLRSLRSTAAKPSQYFSAPSATTQFP